MTKGVLMLVAGCSKIYVGLSAAMYVCTWGLVSVYIRIKWEEKRWGMFILKKKKRWSGKTDNECRNLTTTGRNY